MVSPLSAPFTTLSVLARRSDLDQRLAAGADSHSDPALKLRAAQLCRMRTRQAIAARLRRMIDAARRGSDGLFGVGGLAREEVLAESDALADLAVRLVAIRPVNPMGAALAKVLVSDANSPVRVGDAEPGTLHAVVRLATAALECLPARSGPANEA